MDRRDDEPEIADILEMEAVAELLEAGNEDDLIAAFIAAKAAEAVPQGPRVNNSGLVGIENRPPRRPDYVLDPTPQNVTPAAQNVLWAARIRTEAEANALAGPDIAMAVSVRSAERLETDATQTMPVDHYQVGAGGEIVPDGSAHQLPAPWRDTVAAPSLITAEASRSRLDLANDAGVLAQSLDICDTIGASNSLERMLAAQLAQIHKISMRAGNRASEAYERQGGAIDAKFREACSIQGQRETNAACRASDAFQSGMLTLQKMRSGGKQSITVTHIQNTQVNNGGQAVVTSGPVATQGPASKQGGGTL